MIDQGPVQVHTTRYSFIVGIHTPRCRVSPLLRVPPWVTQRQTRADDSCRKDPVQARLSLRPLCAYAYAMATSRRSSSALTLVPLRRTSRTSLFLPSTLT
jgi:hypothetical protein